MCVWDSGAAGHRIHKYIFVDTSLYVGICTYVYMYTYIYIYTCIDVLRLACVHGKICIRLYKGCGLFKMYGFAAGLSARIPAKPFAMHGLDTHPDGTSFTKPAKLRFQSMRTAASMALLGDSFMP